MNKKKNMNSKELQLRKIIREELNKQLNESVNPIIKQSEKDLLKKLMIDMPKTSKFYNKQDATEFLKKLKRDSNFKNDLGNILSLNDMKKFLDTKKIQSVIKSLPYQMHTSGYTTDKNNQKYRVYFYNFYDIPYDDDRFEKYGNSMKTYKLFHVSKA